MTRWVLLTGEYQPMPGGVADYTRLVAAGLAAHGDAVEVWVPPGAKDPGDPGVRVRTLPDHYGPRSLAALDRRLGGHDADRVILQYVPQAFGAKGMNVPFCLWLAARRRHRFWVMFHEVAFPIERGQRVRHKLLGAVTHAMAAILARSAGRLLLSTEAWRPILARLAPRHRPADWLPVPSNLPTQVPAGAVAGVRDRIGAGPGTVVVGHFGTYSGQTTWCLDRVFPALLTAEPRRVGVVVGRGADGYAARIATDHPALKGRVWSAAGAADVVAAHVAATDLLVQPYVDGATTRRGSLMAAVGLGRPVVSTAGPLTEAFWTETGAVALAPVDRPEEVLGVAERLLRDPAARARLGDTARQVYDDRFAIGRTVDSLRRLAGEPAAPGGTP